MNKKVCSKCKQEKDLSDFYCLKTNKYSYECRECHRQYDKIYRAESEKNKKYRKEYIHSDHAKEYRRQYRRRKDLERKKEDFQFKLECNIRSFLCTSFRRRDYKKSKKLEQIVGLSKVDFINYLTQTWKKRYHCDWTGQDCHIDHIIPLSTAQTEQDIIELCYYTNLQLLTPEENLKKSNKVTV